jgi:hypothetical protein
LYNNWIGPSNTRWVWRSVHLSVEDILTRE